MGVGLFEGLTFKVAEGDDRLRALELQHEVYTKDLGHVPRDRFDSEAFFLVVYEETGQAVASCRMVGPHQRPFDFEEFVNLSDFLSADRVPALVGRLCTRHDRRGVSKNAFIQIGMLKLAYSFARKVGITDFVMYTYPNLREFYRGAFFQLVDCTFDHPDWGRVELMHLDLIDFEKRHASTQQPLARLLLAQDLPNFLF